MGYKSFPEVFAWTISADIWKIKRNHPEQINATPYRILYAVFAGNGKNQHIFTQLLLVFLPIMWYNNSEIG